MRVLIDGTPLLLKSAGVKNYIYHWASALIRKAPEQIEVFPFLGGRVGLQHEKSVVSPLGTAARLALVQFMNFTGNWSKSLLCSRYDLFHVSQIFLNPPRRDSCQCDHLRHVVLARSGDAHRGKYCCNEGVCGTNAAARRYHNCDF